MDSTDVSARSGIARYAPITRLPTTTKLSEISASENNARAGMSALPTTSTSSMKHKASHLPEPASKIRKASNEHTGETVGVPTNGTRAVNNSNRPPSSHGLSSSTTNMRPAIVGRPLVGTTSTYGHNRSQSALTNSQFRPSKYNAGRPTAPIGVKSLAGGIQSSRANPTNCNDPIFSPPDFFNVRKFRDRETCGSSSSGWTSRSASSGTITTCRSVSGEQGTAPRAALNRRQEDLMTQAARRITSLSNHFQGLRLRSDDSNKSKALPVEVDKREHHGSTSCGGKSMTTSCGSHIPRLSPKKLDPLAEDDNEAALSPQVEARQVKKMTRKQPSWRSSSSTKQPTPQRRGDGEFLNKMSDLRAPTASWDHGIEAKLENMEGMFNLLKSQMDGTTFEKSATKEMIELLKTQVADLNAQKNQLLSNVDAFRTQLEEARAASTAASLHNEHMKRKYEIDVEELERKHKSSFEDLLDQHRKEIDRLRTDTKDIEASLKKEAKEELDALIRKHEEILQDVERRWRTELNDEKAARRREVQELAQQRDTQLQNAALDIGQRTRETENIKSDLERRTAEIELEKSLRSTVEARLAEASASILTLESTNKAMKAKIDFLESDNQAQSQAFADLHKRMQEAIETAAEAKAKLRAEETLRRKLHNQVQELKGNIRVFCRVRPTLGAEDEDAAKIKFPDQEEDSKELVVAGPETKSAMGNVSQQNHNFSFDRVFGPLSQNADVFDEISQLVQSALDGYNVCIFCYGQTGSGKTHTMSSMDGMIPRATRQIYETAKSLEEKGWTYKMEGSFIEVYNETLNDLLGNAEDLDKKKHEIRHDTQRQKTTVTEATSVELDSADRVADVLKRADKNRSVAATKANQRSSRSHSVFILSLMGENSITGERSEGTLNLVDLAGSERLAHSQAEGQRLKETQNINKSLSCLGDVIGALGRGDGGHVPYRNSKLTYLLQYSLGGNSKTLMFVMISPLQAHLGETLTSLKFATKVHNTHIGTAKKQTKVS